MLAFPGALSARQFTLAAVAGLALTGLAAAGPAAAAVHFTAAYTIDYALSATVDPTTGAFITQPVVPRRTYAGTFEFDLAGVTETVAAAGPGQQRRTVDVALTFQPFDFAPDLQALVDAEALPIPLAPTTFDGTIHFERLETLAGAVLAYEEMSNLFRYAENRFSLPLGQIQALYRSVGAELGNPGASVGAGLASAAPADIAAYFLGSRQVWQIGAGTLTSGPGFLGPTVHDGINHAGSLQFTSVSFVDDTVAAAVPEPSAWALMILGFGGAGAALRRRRSHAA